MLLLNRIYIKKIYSVFIVDVSKDKILKKLDVEMKRFLLILIIITFNISVIFIESGCKEAESCKQEINKNEVESVASKIAVNKIHRSRQLLNFFY